MHAAKGVIKHEEAYAGAHAQRLLECLTGAVTSKYCIHQHSEQVHKFGKIVCTHTHMQSHVMIANFGRLRYMKKITPYQFKFQA